MKMKNRNTTDYPRKRGDILKAALGENIRKARIIKGMSQHYLADRLHVDRSTIASWETGRRVPDVDMIARIAEVLSVPVDTLIGEEDHQKKPLVIMVDDEKIILAGGIPILQSVMPNAEIVGFTKPSEAISFAKGHHVQLAFLDIEMGKISGIDLCRELLKINIKTNVIYLTAYMDYSFDAWKTGASGFLIKPLDADAVRAQLSLLRHPVGGLKTV